MSKGGRVPYIVLLPEPTEENRRMASFIRTARALWKGAGKDGSGSLTTDSKALDGQAYSAGMRFGEDPGTNPEELIAAAHAGCFNMALAFALSKSGTPPEELLTEAKVTIEGDPSGFVIRKSELVLTGKVPGMSAADFAKAAEDAKKGCPVSKVLNAEIVLTATLA
jgi:lipoyl-dependent peroxiredoxin